MIGFTIREKENAIGICCDEDGIAALIEALEQLRSNRGHLHLRSPARGGHTLAEKTPWGEDAIAEVIITWAGD